MLLNQLETVGKGDKAYHLPMGNFISNQRIETMQDVNANEAARKRTKTAVPSCHG